MIYDTGRCNSFPGGSVGHTLAVAANQPLFAELLGERLYLILLWPGVVVHELSHLLGALLTLTRVTGFSLWPRGGVLGSVTHEASGNPLTLILVSIFPLLGGTFVLWVLVLLLVPGAPTAAPVVALAHGFIATIVEYISAWWRFVADLWSALDFGTWQSWLFLYLVLVIGAHLAPSNRDLTYTAAGLTALSLLTVLLVWGGSLIGQASRRQAAQLG
ncbi:MAG: hypothetical protein HY974_00535 [Candidatus Kerfeldbacteria bacterium]|nr:hypothetical protein [Candidatus Kerfeldbacteria bacterium]